MQNRLFDSALQADPCPGTWDAQDRESIRNKRIDPKAQAAAAKRAIASLTLAFSADPMARWVYPDPGQYLTHFPNLIRHFGGRAFLHNTADTIDEGGAVALWLPPGVSPNEELLMNLLQVSVPEKRQAAVFSIFEQMDRFHPTEPHWYLPLLGVEPGRQGCGLGSRLLRLALLRCDQEGLPAYLEATHSRNRALYERHGFEVMGRIQADHSPPLIPMFRSPRDPVQD